MEKKPFFTWKPKASSKQAIGLATQIRIKIDQNGPKMTKRGQIGSFDRVRKVGDPGGSYFQPNST
jgi:hypothetical protein